MALGASTGSRTWAQRQRESGQRTKEERAVGKIKKKKVAEERKGVSVDILGQATEAAGTLVQITQSRTFIGMFACPRGRAGIAHQTR